MQSQTDRLLRVRDICGDHKAVLPILSIIPTTSNQLLWLKALVFSLKVILILLEIIIECLDL